jgi:hypothetical protein
MKRTLVLTGAALVLSVAGFASPKSWDIVVASVSKAGALELPAGSYNVKLSGNLAVFKSTESGKSFSVPVKVDSVARKYGDTAVVSRKQGNTQVIESIELGGTATELEFGD